MAPREMPHQRRVHRIRELQNSLFSLQNPQYENQYFQIDFLGKPEKFKLPLQIWRHQPIVALFQQLVQPCTFEMRRQNIRPRLSLHQC